MPWVRFVQDFNWTPPGVPQMTIAFKRGMRFFVTTPCASSAIAAGKAELAPPPLKEDPNGRG